MQAVLETLPKEFQEFREIVQALAKLVLQVRLFPPRHPSVERSLGAAFMRLDAALQHKKSVKLLFSNGVVYCLNFELDMTDKDDKAVHLLREAFVRHSIGEIEFMKGTTKEEIASFAGILAQSSGREQQRDSVSLGSMIRNIRLRHGYICKEEAAEKPSESAGRKTGECVSEQNGRAACGESKMGTVVRGVLDRLEKIQSKEGTKAGAAILGVLGREGGNTSTVLLLSSLKEYDDYTFIHSVNVAVISAAIARSHGLGEEFIDSIAHAALLHDIGKIYVPRGIIHKGGRLTPSEWQAVKRHPVDGERILREERLDLLCRRVAW